MKTASLLATVLAAVAAFGASAQEIRIGLSGSFSGPAATNGIPYRNTSEVFPTTLAGVPVKWVLLDDASDPTTAARNARKFVDDKIDAILGSTSTVSALAMNDVAVEGQTLQIALSPIAITEAKRPWVFNLPQPAIVMVSAVAEDLKKKNLGTVAFIGFTDGWGDLNWTALNEVAKTTGLRIVAGERFNRTDTSVTAQAYKIMAAKPDAVFVGGSGTSSALPQITLRDLGYTGPIYQTHGSVMKPFIDAAGPAGEGTLLPTGPVVAATELPDTNPIKPVALDFIQKYEAKWGKGSANPVAAYAWDAMLLLDAAAKQALLTAKPGTAEFRTALRDAMQSGREVVGTNAVYRYTPTDHYGVDERARVLVEVKGGAFRLSR